MTVSLGRLRRPEYTGENRCWPCTLVNTVLLVAAALVLAFFGRIIVAAVVAAVGAGVIALRGYLVPYTPRFAPRLVAALPGDPFHGGDHGHGTDEGGSIAVDEHPGGDAVLTAAFEAGVVVPEGDNVRLDPDFRETWREEMAAIRDDSTEKLADRADEVTPSGVEVRLQDEFDEEYLVLDHENGGITTLRRANTIAELSAVRALEGRIDDPGIRLAAGQALRPFLDRCPDCGGDLRVATDACCGTAVPLTQRPPEHLLCTDCDAQLYTYDRGS